MLSFELKGVKRPVFVRAGTIFKGHGTQPRTSSTGVVLAPKELNLVEVFCVHASHGISPRSGLSTMIDVVPRKVENVLTSPLKSLLKLWEVDLRRMRSILPTDWLIGDNKGYNYFMTTGSLQPTLEALCKGRFHQDTALFKVRVDGIPVNNRIYLLKKRNELIPL